ncbi:unnamed protein product, partial [Darwinula stevensoni]
MDWRTSLLPFFLALLQQAQSEGVFELRLRAFHNDLGKDDQGDCCSGVPDPQSGVCSGVCHTRFHLCLAHYQVRIESGQCTFGVGRIPVIGDNSVFFTDRGSRNPLINSIPLNFTWPGDFSLIIEAWHVEGDNDGVGN